MVDGWVVGRGPRSRLNAKESALACAAEKPCLDERIEYLVAGAGVKPPQALHLTTSEKQSGISRYSPRTI